MLADRLRDRRLTFDGDSRFHGSHPLHFHKSNTMHIHESVKVPHSGAASVFRKERSSGTTKEPK
jgi:hypothetical protein